MHECLADQRITVLTDHIATPFQECFVGQGRMQRHLIRCVVQGDQDVWRKAFMAQAEIMHVSAFGFGDGFVHTATLFKVTGHGVICGGSKGDHYPLTT